MTLAELLRQPDWMHRAACRDLDSSIFFPARNGPSDKRARRICAGCPVAEPCLEYALDFAQHYDQGIYAGTSARERRELRRQRRVA